MKKKIWIFNHYATDHYLNKGGRHYWFAKYLKKNGYEPVVFCSNIRHNSNDSIALEEKSRSTFLFDNDIPFVFIKTKPYEGNGINRILNMYSFYKNLLKEYNVYVNKFGKPDIILASSVHPLTLIAGIKISRKLNIPCICEIRDLWPESIVAYGKIKRSNPLLKLLYYGEKWIYKKADSIIMTWQGGGDYIIDRGWEKEIKLNKIHHINNGVVIEDFDFNKENYVISDLDLKDPYYKNIIYTGSIRKVNNIGLILDVAKLIKEKDKRIRFIIYGTGDEEQSLRKRCIDENISNVLFKGRVEKKYIANITSNAYANLLHNSSTILDKYGQSQNKMFEYLAAGRCIVQTYSTGYSLINDFGCGLCAKEQEPEQIANIIMSITSNESNTKKMGENARNVALKYDFSKLTEKLINIIEKN